MTEHGTGQPGRQPLSEQSNSRHTFRLSLVEATALLGFVEDAVDEPGAWEWEEGEQEAAEKLLPRLRRFIESRRS